MHNHPLPAGFRSRPATFEDLEPLAAMLNRCSQALIGADTTFVADLRADWSAPGFDLARDTCLVFSPQGEIAGYADIWDVSDPHVHIHTGGKTHPDFRGRGIGSFLLAWAEQRARQSVFLAPPDARVTMNSFIMTIDAAAMQLMQDAGFDLVRYNLRMRIDLDALPKAPALPEGISIRPMRIGQDERALAIAVRESFRDHWGFVERPLEQDVAMWAHHFETDPFFDPKLYFLAWDGDLIAGISLCSNGFYDDRDLGWVSTLGVLRPWRRRGLGLALLQHSFCELYALGRQRIGLGVDASSLTGATRLYEKAGMRSDEQRRFANFEKELRPGVELGTQTAGEYDTHTQTLS